MLELHSDLGAGNDVIGASRMPLYTTTLVLAGSYGLIRDRTQAKTCECSHCIVPGGPSGQPDLCLLCDAAAHGVDHMLCGFECPAIKALRISRHDGAGLEI